MKFKINFDHMPEYVLIGTEGEASAQGFDDLLTKLVDSPEWITGTHKLVDHRKLMMYNLASDDIRIIEDIVKRHSKKMSNGRCALVVDDALGFGLARMYELIGGESVHQEAGVFYEIDKAIEWLNT
jgi:hypothetical protein